MTTEDRLIQWYPGHIAKAQRQLKEKLGMVDCVVELVDARLPISSHFPFVDELLGSKNRIIAINKSDLAPAESLAKALEYWQEKGFPAVALNIPERQGVQELRKELQRFHEALSARMKQRGRLPRKLRTLIMGLPNVGKSTLINALINKRSMKVGDKPGVTKSLQWVSIAKDLELLDSPGVIPPKLEDQHVALKLALIGSVSQHSAPPIQLAELGLKLLHEEFPGYLQKAFGQDPIYLPDVGRMRNFLQKGGEIDLDRTAISFLSDLRSGKLPLLCLENF
ncbi:ribosome biogenesis GTPase YlqF [bacterium (Candidatus Blackallbacteria) CG17_big_fil_post_rev_8_21_14_2_50_48_46]|uniref:Ribosome biogenesis GTPase A n=1 Tax=bacterium (Candidatus Blackallbacteria) CG17_big_fil_post_rev_8_21_14_2_50_48_46 TaxID=2014261 RepID=A0A2M7FYS0_9BACT|nr:MAG: ribosome biogenesis GTPase YlqF [bacterium (Candidatus Blackallbacteria) CG18_big_fil_WC_8_21_14_2_50_49_26]PIW14524.1 MAG: ribosome biogenesis GTPase YlqF [bacterium (Candidatus Blackallbacteria) CG17_big_fil_post_rev_8_21_14_2_50_48_46]PIW47209.1 MAG: ribosome biogenesis GTPase YlqF [bacterium (Candidatus Blackallbacteria) CG13_big_fil_rev_8_21_14_2_50_49_14]